MLRKVSIVVLVAGIFFIQGCAVYAASMAGYMETRKQYAGAYNEYKTEMEQKGQTAEDFNVWVKGQPLTSNQIKVLKNLAIIDGEEAREIKEREALRQAENKL